MALYKQAALGLALPLSGKGLYHSLVWNAFDIALSTLIFKENTKLVFYYICYEGANVDILTIDEGTKNVKT